MTTALRIIPLRLARAALAAAALAAMPAPAFAQDTSDEARLRKIEAEVRALQRKVFPGGDARFFEPQIGPGTQPATTGTPAVPASGGPAPASALTDILVRLDALERQLQALTARSEEQANVQAQLEARLTALETAGNAPLAATPLTAAPASGPVTTPPPALPPRIAVQPSPAPTPAARTLAATPPPPAPPVASAAAPSAARLAAVQAIAKPQTADAGDDEYSFGFRLWSAGFFPEARQQLTRFVEQYPGHPRISYGRNLLGRAFLDDNLPEEAARWFYKNYTADKTAERAPDSLFYLAQAMIAQNNTAKACIALAEFGETYPLIASGRLADEYKASVAKVTCR